MSGAIPQICTGIEDEPGADGLGDQTRHRLGEAAFGRHSLAANDGKSLRAPDGETLFRFVPDIPHLHDRPHTKVVERGGQEPLPLQESARVTDAGARMPPNLPMRHINAFNDAAIRLNLPGIGKVIVEPVRCNIEDHIQRDGKLILR